LDWILVYRVVVPDGVHRENVLTFVNCLVVVQRYTVWYKICLHLWRCGIKQSHICI